MATSKNPPKESSLKTEIAEPMPTKQHQSEWLKKPKNTVMSCQDCDQTFSSRALYNLHICLGKFLANHMQDLIMITNQSISLKLLKEKQEPEEYKRKSNPILDLKGEYRSWYRGCYIDFG